MIKNDFPHWYALYVKSRQEKKVNHLLGIKRIESFLPLVKKVRQWSDRKKIIEIPLFTSYLFVKIYDLKTFYQVLDVDGVCSYVKFGKDIAKVKEKEINYIKLLLGDNNIKDVANSLSDISAGETKEIVMGPLQGLECEILELKGKGYVSVRTEMFHRNIIATVPRHYLYGLGQR